MSLKRHLLNNNGLLLADIPHNLVISPTSHKKSETIRHFLPRVFEKIEMIEKFFRLRLELFNVQMVDVELFSSLSKDLLLLLSLCASSLSPV